MCIRCCPVILGAGPWLVVCLCWLVVVVKARLVPSVLHYPLCLLLDDGVVHSRVLFLMPFGLRLFLGV